MGIKWIEEEWSKLKCVNYSCSKNVSIRENCYKMIWGWYLTLNRIKMFLQPNGKFWRCQKEKAGFMHMWWGCAKIKVLWHQVHGILQSIVGKVLWFVPRIMLLCDLPQRYC